MSKQKGISMIELVIVLVIIIIIASFSIYTGRGALNQASAAEIYGEINSMRNAINSINIKKSMNDDFELVAGVHYDVKVEDSLTKSEFISLIKENVSDEEYENTYIIYGMDMMSDYERSSVKDFYGMDTIKHSYLVNFNDVKVDLLKSIRVSDRVVRTFEQVRSLVDEGNI